VNVLFVIVSAPLLWMPPAKRAELPVTITPLSVRLPAFCTAPPLPPPALPLRNVRFCSVSDPLPVTLNSRNCGAPLPRSSTAPLPTIVIGVVMDGMAMLFWAVRNE